MESRTPVPPETPVSFEFVLRYPASSEAALHDEATRLLSGDRPTTARAAVVAARIADPGDIERVRAFSTRAGLTVESVDPRARSVRVTGSAGTVNALFGIRLVDCRAGSESWREYDGDPRTPADIAPIVEATLGLSHQPIA